MVDPFLLPVVTLHDGVPLASSLDVAAYFERDHDFVFRLIEDLSAAGAPGHTEHFRIVQHLPPGGGAAPIRVSYEMTRAGFLMLARGLTGPNCARRRERYLDTFDRSRERRRSPEPPPPSLAHTVEAPSIVPAGHDGLLTMCSRDIADLCETRHNQVVETIDRLFAKGVLRESRKTTRLYSPPGGGRPTEVYDLTKRDTLVVVSGYNDEVRARIIDRWMVLEGQAAAPFRFDPSDPKVMLAVLIHLQHQAQTAGATVERQAATLNQIAGAEGALCITDAAKALGRAPKAFFALLYRRRWIYRRGGRGDWVAHADRCRAGLMDHRAVTYEREGESVIGSQAIITPKGLRILAELLASDPAWRD